MSRALFLLLFLTLRIHAADPSPIEDNTFLLESGWNRDDAVVQSTSFFLSGREAWASELTQEWAASSPRHQLSYTIPLFVDGGTGLGDVTLNYRFQLHGNADSRSGIAPRVSLVLPTRSERFGGRAHGVQVSVPVSTKLSPRLVSHTNAGASWFRGGRPNEVTLAESVVFAMHERVALAFDAAYTRCGGNGSVVLRPGVQFAFNARGVQIAPGIAVPLGARGMLVYVAFERAL